MPTTHNGATRNDEQLRRLEGLIGNAMMTRYDFLRQLMDPRRSINDECGYPDYDDMISPQAYRRLYDREPIAARVVEVLAKESWQVQPTVYEDEDTTTETAFEKDWNDLSRTLMIGRSWFKGEQSSVVWEYLERLDILSGIGQFGVLLFGFDDGKNLAEPVDGLVAPLPSGTTYPYGQRDPASPISAGAPGSSFLSPIYAQPARESDYRSVPQSPEYYPTTPAPLGPSGRPNAPATSPAGETAPPPSTQSDQLPRPDLLPGSQERLYQPGTQMGMPPYGQPPSIPSLSPAFASPLSGTDQQYFGVQFGPSEVLATNPTRQKRRLLFLRVFDQSLVQVVRYEWNILSPRFGMPVMYRVTLNDPRVGATGVGLPLATVFVHWTRLLHIADNYGAAAPSEVFAIPRMQQVYNRLLDLNKVYGGSAEMYWRGAFPGFSLETHPQLGGEVDVDEAGLQDMMEQYMNGLQRYLSLIGMSAKSLAPQVSDPSSQINIAIEAICIKINCPIRVFKGSERGELASSEDDAQWNDELKHREEAYITPHIIVPFVDRLIMAGVLSEPDPDNGFYVKWPDLDSNTDSEKATIALTQTQALAAYAQGGIESIMAPLDYLVHILGFDVNTAQAILDAAEEAEPVTQSGVGQQYAPGGDEYEGFQDDQDARQMGKQQQLQDMQQDEEGNDEEAT